MDTISESCTKINNGESQGAQKRNKKTQLCAFPPANKTLSTFVKDSEPTVNSSICHQQVQTNWKQKKAKRNCYLRPVTLKT
jgi:hypothetical protein